MSKMRQVGVLSVTVLVISILGLTTQVLPFSLSISTPRVYQTVNPGETVTGTLTVSNPSSSPMGVKVYPQDFVYVAPFDGSKQFFPAGTVKSSCANWISFSPNEFTIPAFGKGRVDYTIKVPNDAKGSYQCVLFFETFLGKTQTKEGYNVSVMGRVGSLFILEVEGSIKKAEVKDVSVSGSSIKGKFCNTGETFIHAAVTYYVMDKEGMVVDRGKLSDMYTLSSDTVPFSIELSDKIPPGEYDLVCTFDLQKGDVVVKEISFTKDASGAIHIVKITD